MRVLFFGSAAIGFQTLENLLASSRDELVGVLTQPDRPAGRKLNPVPCPVKTFAEERGVPVFSPEKVGSAESLEVLRKLRADLFVVVAYGQYIPQSVLALPPCGAINLHPSLLPKYRGSSPIQWALANGDSMTGVTILYVSEKMDSGDILCQREVPIGPEDNALTMDPVLAQTGADLLMEAVEQIRSGTVAARPQDDAAAVEVRKLTKEDGRLDWTLPARMLNNRIRGFISWPGCFCEAGSGRLKVFRARVESGAGRPGELLDVSGEGPLVATGEDALRLLEVQPEGKRAMDGAAYLRGHPLQPGDRLTG
ncbi:MAG: methionyl-tRNA formyltransferase [Verrucomicrobia bacterium]|nr:methionyl-tRNA formyltransferase [Verrucomicrobiota bacterium]